MRDLHTDDMRDILYDVYDSKKWHDKVDRMSDKQVTAIYLKFHREGKLYEPYKTRKKPVRPRHNAPADISFETTEKKADPEPEQLMMDGF